MRSDFCEANSSSGRCTLIAPSAARIVCRATSLLFRGALGVNQDPSGVKERDHRALASCTVEYVIFGYGPRARAHSSFDSQLARRSSFAIAPCVRGVAEDNAPITSPGFRFTNVLKNQYLGQSNSETVAPLSRLALIILSRYPGASVYHRVSGLQPMTRPWTDPGRSESRLLFGYPRGKAGYRDTVL